MSELPIGEWEGVTASADGRVNSLDLSGRGLTGPLPPEVGNLTSLTELHLRDNQLSGPLPPGLGNLPGLEKLALDNNQLNGNIPPQLANLTALAELTLANNALSGPIPAELANLANLESLDLSGNALTGPVPPELGNLASLQLLYLDNNRLSGDLPSELGNLSSLQQVSVWGNKFAWAGSYANGVLADTVALVALYESTLSHAGDAWNGWLTPRPLRDWGNVAVDGGRVTELGLRNQGLKGKLPPALGLLTSLQKLDFSENPGPYRGTADHAGPPGQPGVVGHRG